MSDQTAGSVNWREVADYLRDAGAALFNDEDEAQARWIAAVRVYGDAEREPEPPTDDGPQNPTSLWEQANAEHPDDLTARFAELLRAAGYDVRTDPEGRMTGFVVPSDSTMRDALLPWRPASVHDLPDFQRVYDDDATIEVRRGDLQALLDLATGSMDFGSGFWDNEQVEIARKIAGVLGVDPLLATPSNFTCQYKGEHHWQEIDPANQPRWNGATRFCTLCRHTSTDPTPIDPASHTWSEWRQTGVFDLQESRFCLDCGATEIKSSPREDPAP